MIEERLKNLNIILPQAPAPKGAYTGCVRTGNLVFISGQGPAVQGTPVYIGKVGETVSCSEAYDSARLCGINLLTQLKANLGSLDKVKKVVSIHGYVNCTPDFFEQSLVINGASDLMIEVFGNEKGSHSRCAVGVAALPGNISTEVEMIVEISDE